MTLGAGLFPARLSEGLVEVGLQSELSHESLVFTHRLFELAFEVDDDLLAHLVELTADVASLQRVLEKPHHVLHLLLQELLRTIKHFQAVVGAARRCLCFTHCLRELIDRCRDVILLFEAYLLQLPYPAVYDALGLGFTLIDFLGVFYRRVLLLWKRIAKELHHFSKNSRN